MIFASSTFAPVITTKWLREFFIFSPQITQINTEFF